MQILDVADLSDGAFEEILSFLRAGGVIGFPTDTAYGLGADPFNESAVRRIFEIKGRPEDKPILLLVNSIAMAEEVAPLSDRTLSLAERFWPGPLTMILPARAHVSPLVTAGTRTIGIRWPAAPFANRLVAGLERPVTGTSANASGKPSAISVEEVRDQLEGRLVRCIDGGVLPARGGSTLLDLTGLVPEILREGPISKTALQEVVNLR